jgi:hypothetical protein
MVDIELNDKDNAHIGVFGKTGCGKTQVSKQIIDDQIEKGYVKPRNVYVFGPKESESEWKELGYRHSTNFQDKFEAIMSKHHGTDTPNAIILFDDYINSENNAFNDKLMKRLFTEGRKHHIHGIIQSHEPNTINSSIRTSLGDKIIFPSTATDAVEKLGNNFLLGDRKQMKDTFRKCLKLGKYSNIQIDSMGNIKFNKPTSLNSEENNNSNMSANAMTNNNIGDNNNNNTITQIGQINSMSIERKELIQNLMQSQEISLMTVRLDHEVKQENLKYDTYELCKLGYRNPAQHEKLKENLNQLLKSGNTVKDSNVHKAALAFMSKNFPSEPYRFKQDNTGLANYAAHKFMEGDTTTPKMIALTTVTNQLGQGAADQAINYWFGHNPFKK